MKVCFYYFRNSIYLLNKKMFKNKIFLISDNPVETSKLIVN